MLVLLISECGGNAWKRTRRIADRYLERVGERTWRGRLTLEGLAHLRNDLATSASRETAVACHRVATRDRFSLEWIVGSARRFGPNGEVTTYEGAGYDRYLAERPEMPEGLRRLRRLLEVAGLFHDVGKANAAFQAKLWAGAPRADPVRHEILSLLVFDAWASMDKDPVDDFRSLLGVDLKLPDSGFRIDDGRLTERALVGFLIATHHRLLDTRTSNTLGVGELLFTLSHHIRLEDLGASEPAGARQLNPALLDDEMVWRIRRIDRQALRSEIDRPTFESLAAYGRCGLILADQLVSKQELDQTRHSDLPLGRDSLVANTLREGGGKQSLVEHLVKVSEEGPCCVSDLHDIPRLAPSLASRGLPRPFRERAAGRFAWQDQVRGAVQASLPAGAGFFGVLLASTGSGKTQMAAKLMATLRDEVRYCVCLALRSLTVQAGADYRDQLGLTESDLAVVMGERAMLELQEEDGLAAVIGSETSFGLEDVELDGGPPPSFRLEEPLLRHVRGNAKARALVAAPVLISTIDQLMPVADQRRTAFLPAALRLISSDLVIDEADAFSEVDLVAIGRLVHLAGLFGRHVVLSSATVPPAQIRSFWRAWRNGYSAHCRFMAKLDLAYAGLFSDTIDPKLVEAGSEDLDHEISDFATTIAGAISSKPSPRRAAFMPRECASDPSTLFEAVAERLELNHGRFARQTLVQRRRLSVQLVHFAHVDTCVLFAEHLEGRSPAATSFRHVVYHARHPLLVRAEIERFLDRVLRRKDGDKALLAHPSVRSALEVCQTRDLCIVVIATAVEEIGRDHDFDAAIVEPHSSRSIIQLAGRVQRHRLVIPAHPNFYIMPAPFRFVRDKKEQHPYRRPGVEGFDDNINTTPFYLPSPWLDGVLDPDAWTEVTASPRLLEEGPEALVALEHIKLRAYLEGTSFFSLGSVHDGRMCWLSAKHPDEMRFRKGRKNLSLYLDCAGDRWVFKEFYTKPGEAMADFPTEGPRIVPQLQLLELSPVTVFAAKFPNATGGDRERLMRRFLRTEVPAERAIHGMDTPWRYEASFGLHR
jgi:CRISPR-associated endonuclease/helicase Cas3